MTPATRAGSRSRWRVLAGERAELWPAPVLAVAAAVAFGIGMPRLDQRLIDRLPATLTDYLFSGGPEAARGVLAAVAGSLITVTSLTFSLTVVTLQLASSQYSPRVLRTFARDRLVQATLALLLATFTYAVTVLRTVRARVDGDPGFVPQLSVTLAYVLALASVLAVAVFLAHLARKIRVESILRDVHEDSALTIRRVLGDPGGHAPSTALPTPPVRAGTPVCAPKSGFLTSVDDEGLLAAAGHAEAVVRVDRMPGESIIAGTPIATAWGRDGGPLDNRTHDRLVDEVSRAIRTGFERTSEQDVAFGLRQIVDVAVKALSPGINDPTTAVHALGHATALLCDAAGRDPGPRVLRDDSGRARVVLLHPDFATLLDLVVSQPRRYGAAEPQVLARLLSMLREVAWVARDEGQRAAVTAELARTRAVIGRQEIDHIEVRRLAGLADLVEQALAGLWPVGVGPAQP